MNQDEKVAAERLRPFRRLKKSHNEGIKKLAGHEHDNWYAVSDEVVPLEDEVYDPIREEVTEPLTVCGILSRLYERYGVGVGIGKYRDHQHICLYGWKKGDEKIQIKDETFMSANDAILMVLRMFVREINK